jgi:hypothetical protein
MRYFLLDKGSWHYVDSGINIAMIQDKSVLTGPRPSANQSVTLVSDLNAHPWAQPDLSGQYFLI